MVAKSVDPVALADRLAGEARCSRVELSPEARQYLDRVVEHWKSGVPIKIADVYGVLCQHFQFQWGKDALRSYIEREYGGRPWQR